MIPWLLNARKGAFNLRLVAKIVRRLNHGYRSKTGGLEVFRSNEPRRPKNKKGQYFGGQTLSLFRRAICDSKCSYLLWGNQNTEPRYIIRIGRLNLRAKPEKRNFDIVPANPMQVEIIRLR